MSWMRLWRDVVVSDNLQEGKKKPTFFASTSEAEVQVSRKDKNITHQGRKQSTDVLLIGREKGRDRRSTLGGGKASSLSQRAPCAGKKW